MNREKIECTFRKWRKFALTLRGDLLERAKPALSCAGFSKLSKFQRWPVLIVSGLVVVLIYSISKVQDHPDGHVTHVRETEFKKSRVLGDPYAEANQAKEQMLAKAARDYADGQQATAAAIAQVNARLDELAARMAQPSAGVNGIDASTQATVDPSYGGTVQNARPTSVVSGEAATGSTFGTEVKAPILGANTSLGSSMIDRGYRSLERAKGPAMITFPVKGGTARDVSEVVLPVGSYVKATLLTGVDAPEANPYPVLLQLDFANIIPNNKVLDLRGCFMVAKAQGDLSTERVQMQATKLSCVSRTGQMFERDINGFVADGSDNSFAVNGAVNGKQDRVAAMAFLSSVVEGVGRAIQMAQTTEQTSVDGHSRRVITGDQGKYMAYGGASTAGGMVAQWYLKQAQSLLPTIKVGSGQTVWVVMNETVALPHEYFKKSALGASHEKDQSIVNRLLD